MKPLFKSLTQVFLSVLPFFSPAQTADWLPLPYGQTSYFQNQNDMEIIPMATDWWSPGGIGDFYGIYKEALIAEFDTCAINFWNPAFFVISPPKSDFQGFTNSGFSIMIDGFLDYFTIPLQVQPGDWSFFGNEFILRYDFIISSNVLGIPDSVRHYSVYLDDSTSQIGEFSLSKKHGLVEFTPFRVYESYPENAGQFWRLIGYMDSTASVGFAMPSRLDYMPYTIGDDLLFQYSYWGFNLEVVLEYHHLNLTSIDTSFGGAGLSGTCVKYDDQGFYIESDSQYTIGFEMPFEDMLAHPYSIPYQSTVSTPFPGFIMSRTQWFEISSNNLLAEFGGATTQYCDSFSNVDGAMYKSFMSTQHGLVYLHKANWGATSPYTHTLYAAEASQFTYGTWPQWLAIDEPVAVDAVKLYPNPATDHLIISGSSLQNGQFQVLSLEGHVVRAGTINTQQLLDISDLRAGQYIVRISTEDQVVTRKFVKFPREEQSR